MSQQPTDNVTQLLIELSNGDRERVDVHVWGIPRATDGGVTWQPTIDVESDVREVCAHPSNRRTVIAGSGDPPRVGAGGVPFPECYSSTPRGLNY